MEKTYTDLHNTTQRADL